MAIVVAAVYTLLAASGSLAKVNVFQSGFAEHISSDDDSDDASDPVPAIDQAEVADQQPNKDPHYLGEHRTRFGVKGVDGDNPAEIEARLRAGENNSKAYQKYAAEGGQMPPEEWMKVPGNIK